MERPFSQTLSFDDLEVLVMVENGGATPREVEDSLGMGPRETKAVFRDWCGAVCSIGRAEPTLRVPCPCPGALPPPSSSSPPWPAA